MTETKDKLNQAEEQTTNIVGDRGEPTGTDRTVRIRALNDQLRTTGRGGMVVMTDGVAALPGPTVAAIFAAIAGFTDFNPDNDPWGEHDCAVMTIEGVRVIWKVDYYDRSRRIHSPDPADPKVTVRVLTVMLSSEY